MKRYRAVIDHITWCSFSKLLRYEEMEPINIYNGDLGKYFHFLLVFSFRETEPRECRCQESQSPGVRRLLSDILNPSGVGLNFASSPNGGS